MFSHWYIARRCFLVRHSTGPLRFVSFFAFIVVSRHFLPSVMENVCAFSYLSEKMSEWRYSWVFVCRLSFFLDTKWCCIVVAILMCGQWPSIKLDANDTPDSCIYNPLERGWFIFNFVCMFMYRILFIDKTLKVNVSFQSIVKHRSWWI